MTTAAPIVKGIQVLQDARQLLSREGAWIQGAAARNPDGIEVDYFNPGATCFCTIGAIYRVTARPRHPDDGRAMAFRLLRGAMPEPFNTQEWTSAEDVVVYANDRPEMTHAGLLSWFDQAIADPNPAPANDWPDE